MYVYLCMLCSEDDAIIEEFCGKGYKKSRMDQYDSVFEELEKGNISFLSDTFGAVLCTFHIKRQLFSIII